MKFGHYATFWNKLDNYAKRGGFPLRVMFELTYRCNFFCRHCYVPDNYKQKTKELKTKEVFLILNQLADCGCFYLGFTGGEPFMRNDIIEILKYAKKRGFQVIIYSNGSLIDERITRRLKFLKPLKIDITLPAISKPAFERISGVRGSREKVFQAIGLLQKQGLNLGFKTCLLKENESEISDIQNFSASLNAVHRLDTLLMPRLDGSPEPYKYRGALRLNPDSHLAGLRQNDSAGCGLDSQTTTKKINRQELFPCGVGLTQAAITPAGELKMCLSIDYPRYNILEISLASAWDRLKEMVNNIEVTADYRCPDCKLRPYCQRCPGSSWLYKKDFSSCPDEIRQRALLLRQAAVNKN